MVDAACDGVEAVEAVERRMAEGGTYDVITMDVEMPRMNGLEATRRVRELGYTGLLVGMTANALTEDVAALRAAGADVVLTKPISTVKLLALVAGVER